MEENSLRVYPANNGDSFLLNFLGFTFLIDGGYVNTYRSFIKDDLLKLQKKTGKLDYLIVTHIDQDHISGINKLVEENNQSTFIKIDNVWHNSLKHLRVKRGEAKENISPIIENITSQSYLREQLEGENEISAIQGSTLARLINEGGYNWNAAFDMKAISINNNPIVHITKDIKLILLSPNNDKIDKLYDYWKKELLKYGFLDEVLENVIFDDAFEIMVSKQKCKKKPRAKDISNSIDQVDSLLSLKFNEDDSASNGSSIAFILEGCNKRVLFLGDSHPSLICNSLKAYYKSYEFPIHFDLVKLSHHGSFANNSPELFSLINSDKMIFSTNGRGHGHPDKETIANIISKKNKELKLYFNYKSETSTMFDNSELRKKYGFQINAGTGETPLDIKF
ncbi:AVAST type 1 anti-phage system MBL fold metallo-hydrolase Avs1a [Aquimarina latercula]|uniref:AVAST type 1 anti-phage system MBL fold metallo-hydrolase Avs1a n=1 Tax=Aquimarina latercula TaxID=987 RepID=UPI0004247962|nr:AVAST type 1 anti-phage system MBL fold metallo-hydrolase Avs1a [Aquimarina latercula]